MRQLRNHKVNNDKRN